MTRVITAVAIAIMLCATPAHGQSARAKAKQDSADRANVGKPGAKPATPTVPVATKPAGKPVEVAAPQAAQQVAPPARDLIADMGANMSLQREVFSYADGGRRDPAVSLMNTSEIRPLITEIQLIGIVYDEEGMNHMAILRNIVDTKKTQYHVKIGQMLGRLKVTQITRREVVFTVDEFGFSRQERLPLKPDTTAKRTP